MKIKGIAAAAMLACAGAANAGTIVIDPTSDGSLYTCPGCNPVVDLGGMVVSGYIQGAIKFSSAGIDGPIESAFLSINPDALPLWDKTVEIYGYGTSIGALDISDHNAGSFLGILTLPDALDFGEDVFFDVTSFLSTVNAPFIAFNLRTELGGTDVFTTIEENYGHASRLTVTTAATSVDEPASLALFAIGLGGLLVQRRRSRPLR